MNRQKLVHGLAERQSIWGIREQTSTDRPDPHAPPFADLREARQALRRQMFALDEPLGELRRVADTIEALSFAAVEAESAIDTSPRAFAYLSDRLDDAVKALEAWNKRAWPLSIIVVDNDLGALAALPGFKDRLAETHALLRDEP
jgi:hypothetical protein